MKGPRVIPFAVFVISAIAVQLLTRASGTEFRLTQLTMSLYSAIVVAGLCLLMGYAGQVSLGHGAFFALGGYTVAVLTTHDFADCKDAAWAGWLKHLHVLVPSQDPYGSSVLAFSPWTAFLCAAGRHISGRLSHWLSCAALARPLPGYGDAGFRVDRVQPA